MKSNTITKITFILMAAGLLALSSCQKEKPLTTQTDADLGTGALDVSQQAVSALQNSSNSFKQDQEESLLSGCAIVTNDTTIKPHVYTIDYGAGCANSQGVIRSGKIKVSYNNANVRMANNKFVITFQNFHNGNEQIAGSITLQNNGLNGAGNLNYTITLAVQTTQGGVTYPLNANLGYEWIAGESTPTTADDQFSLTGSLSGSSSTHASCTGNITSPLISAVACNNQYIKGTIVYTQAGQATKTFDYGNGTCTGNVTVTQSGVSTTKPQGSTALGLKL